MDPQDSAKAEPAGFSLAEREDRLVWIFGSSRSGSTWLLRMLAQLEGVAPIDDPHIGHHLGVWRPIALAWATAEEPPELTTLLEVKRDADSYFFSDRYREAWAPALRDLIATRFDAEAHAHLEGAAAAVEPAVVVKEPGSHAVDVLLSLFPSSRFVFLLRDGRDVVDSWMDAYQEGSWALEEGAYPVSEEGRLAFVRWQSAVWAFRTEMVQRAFERHDPDRRLLVRYEDLRADPARQLKRICSAFAIGGADEERIADVAEASAFERVPSTEKGNGKMVRAARPGGWRENLTPAEQRTMHRIMGPKLAELGYTDGEPEPDDRLLRAA